MHAAHIPFPATPFACRLTKTSCRDATGSQVASASVVVEAKGGRGAGRAGDGCEASACASDVSMQEASQGVR